MAVGSNPTHGLKIAYIGIRGIFMTRILDFELLMVVVLFVTMILFQNCSKVASEDLTAHPAAVEGDTLIQLPDQPNVTFDDEEKVEEDAVIAECLDYQQEVQALGVDDAYSTKFGKDEDKSIYCGENILISGREGLVKVIKYKRSSN
jgi:hypothetical protein